MPARTKLMAFIACLLLILIFLFGYNFYLLTKPLSSEKSPSVPKGIKYLFSIYGVDKTDLLNKPNDAAFDKDGNIFVADTGNNRVLKFDSSGKYLKKYETKKMKYPLGVEVAPDGKIYVTSMQSSQMFLFEPNGTLLKEQPMDRPIALTIFNKKVFVSSPGRIWVYDLKLNELEHWGNPGRDSGQFEYPNGLAVNNKDIVFVSDTNNTRIQVFNKKREPDISRTAGRVAIGLNDKNRPLGLPMGLTFGPNGYLYLVDAFHFSIKVFNEYGKQLAKLGDKGDTGGYFNYPAGIAYDTNTNNRFAVADKYNNRIEVIEITVK
jgi:tripartite motif-containing protein 71